MPKHPLASLTPDILDAAERGAPLILTEAEVQQLAADIEREQMRAWSRSVTGLENLWTSEARPS